MLIDDPAHPEIRAECFGLTEAGTTLVLHPTEALKLLLEHDHVDVEHVRVETHVGLPFTH